MEEPSTDTLRKLAPCWTLAGDERLLTLLQNTHQRLVAKCQETSCQLEQMVSALDDASISLQNVNNQFTALSSSQFIESRVYDDDADVTTDTPSIKEPSKPSPPDELTILKRSIAVIENTHEVITILNDSDTESDSDDDVTDRLVMKPKDLYADRPLPYIIGSEPWKNKWHAGLMPEDSDTDSSTSKVDQNSDQYSQSEPEDFTPVHPMKSPETSSAAHHVRNLSETSSELPSEATPNTKPTPAAVASELARRLAAGLPPPKVVDVVPEYEEVSRPSVSKIYKPQEPVTSTIFPEEPPPLDGSSDEGDIFADLHRHQPYSKQYSRQYVADELFGDDTEQDDEGDIFSDFANQPPSARPTSLFDAGPTPHMFDKQQRSASTGNQTKNNESPTRPTEHTSKTVSNDEEKGIRKPVGGISLFGSNKGAESIGAAILKRNQRKSSSSGDESEIDVPQAQPSPVKGQSKNEKDIFDDLFAKNESKIVKPKVDNVQNNQKKTEEKVNKDPPKAVDLFSDNLFDDIDDIFTTNIVKTSKENKKSIFEDDDDLFSDIAEPKTVAHDVNSNNNVKKTLFDSDDDLFSENIVEVKSANNTSTKVNEDTNNVTEIIKVKENTSIFDEDENDIFSNNKNNKQDDSKRVQNVIVSTTEDNLKSNVEISKNVFKSPSLFDDDDDDESDLFANPVIPSTATNKNEITNNLTVNMSSETNTRITGEKSEIRVDAKVINPDETSNEVSSEMKVDNNKNTHTTLIKTDKITNEQNKSVEITSKTVEKNVICGMPDNKQGLDSSCDVTFEPVKEKLETNNLDNTITINKMLVNDTDKTSDDDFTEQDFDDEPVETPKSVQNNVTEIPDVKTSKPSNLNNIFDNIGLDDEDIFASHNTQSFHKEKEITNKSETQADNSTEITKSDIFADILSEPPVFEKPKEPKRSKNVNALFDDDSDDEALFFKKDEVITDEKPEDFTVKQDRLFGLFTDEPPDDLDDDIFSTLPKPKISNDKIANSDLALPVEVPLANDEVKPVNDVEIVVQATQEIPDVETKTEFKIPSTEIDAKKISCSNSPDEIFTKPQSLIEQQNLSDDDEEFFKSLPAQLPPQNTIITPHEESDEELFKSLPILDQSTKATKESPRSISNTDIFKVPSAKPERKVGKLQLGLNINVNALLPGASPKKVKPTDSPDGQTQSVSEVKNDDTIQSLGFDEKPSSEILDNKLSKERPRIQVKRKPSTRKARREAVRKSGIDFGDDSTDNSSSIDDPPKTRTETSITTDIHKNKEIKDEIINGNDKPKDKESNINPIDTPEIKTKDSDEPKVEPTKPPVKSASTTKIVYILNDEDIFNTSIIENPETKSVVKNDKKTDNFGSTIKNINTDSKIDKKLDSHSSNMEPSQGINTLGKTYQVTSKAEKKMPSLFGEGDADDEELFKSKKPVAKVSIFDSDSEGELFGTKKVENMTKVEKVKEVKGSLFGDDDDDDDLFGTKAKKNVDLQSQPTRATTSAKGPPIPAQTVFEDPLSMFGDDN